MDDDELDEGRVESDDSVQAEDEPQGSTMHWPSVPRLAFGPGEDLMLDARLDWIRDERQATGYYFEAYRSAIEAIYERAASGGIPEYTLLPLAFLWRHQIENRLKRVIRLGRELYGEQHKKPPKGHVLQDLWNEAVKFIEPLGPKGAPELANVAANIQDFHRIDPQSDGFRYTHNVAGTEQTLTKAPESVNIVNFHVAMEAVDNFLTGCAMDLSCRLGFFREEEDSSVPFEIRVETRVRYMEAAREAREPGPAEDGEPDNEHCS